MLLSIKLLWEIIPETVCREFAESFQEFLIGHAARDQSQNMLGSHALRLILPMFNSGLPSTLRTKSAMHGATAQSAIARMPKRSSRRGLLGRGSA